MPAPQTKNSIAIIGAGLVGGAVFRELVADWVRAHQEQRNTGPRVKPASVRHLDIEGIHITATREWKLLDQLQKTKDLLRAEGGVDVEEDGPLKLTLRSGAGRLRIEAETLNILPDGLTAAKVEDETFRRESSLYTFLAAKRPRTLIIGAGLAGILAYRKEVGEIRTLMLAWILATFKRATDELNIATVAILGTTGLGGLGVNIVWTHQSSQEMDTNLTSKILAAYGILGVMDRIHLDTDSPSRWILLTPASLLGYEYLGFGPVKYFAIPKGLPEEVETEVRSRDLSIPLYKPLELNRRSLSDTRIEWGKRRMGNGFLTGAQIKCGESGVMSPLQFACLSHGLQMGFNTDVYIARILLDELMGKASGYNQIPLGTGKVIEPSAQGQNDRHLILERLAQLEQERGIRSCPVYPALGSPRAQKEIVLSDLLYRLLHERYGEATIQQIAAYDPRELANDLWNYLQASPQLLAEITSVIPVISPAGRVLTGPHVMYLNKGITRPSDLQELTDDDRFREFAALGTVDLRPARDSIARQPKVYESGVEVLVNRARFIRDQWVEAFPPDTVDGCGSTLDPRLRHWAMLTSAAKTVFDPVFFVVQFLGGDRPYQ